MVDSRTDTPIRILMLEDNALDAELIGAQLAAGRLKFEATRVWTRETFLDALATREHDIILADHVLPGFDGDSALQLAQEVAPEIPFIFVSGTLTEELAVQALTRGARDYVVKQRLQRLPDAILRCLNESRERAKLRIAEADLLESRHRLQLITDSLPALIAHLDTDHRYRFVNNAYTAWHGLRSDQLIGMHVRDIMGQALFSEIEHFLQKAIEGERVHFEARMPLEGGKVRYALVDCVPETGQDGSVKGYYSLVRDISDLKEAELSLREANESLERQVEERTAALRSSESRLQAVFESSFQHQNLLTPAGLIVDANLASLSAILATKEDVSGTPFRDAPWFSQTPEARDVVDKAIQEAVAGHASRHELKLALPTGSRSFDFSFRPLLDHQGAITAVVSEAVETTARRQAEEALRQSQKIEAVGQLTGGIAHDFNNILTVIGGNVEHAKILIDRMGDVSTVPSRAMDNALKGVTRAASLTQRLLAFARKQPLKSQTVDLNEQILGMQDMLQRTLGELVQLEIVTTADLWSVEVDPSQVEASVLNLAVNARDAMPEGGQLTIEMGNGHLDHDYVAAFTDVSPGQYVFLRIRDTGHGMSKEVLSRVFEPFFTTKEVGRGTGLGLPMVYGFMKQSGGHVLVESTVGGGTLVTMLLPRSTLPVSRPVLENARELERYRINEETVLVAEDNDDVRAYTVEVLRQLGYKVLEAHDGASAMRLLERKDVKVDLLFSDIVMPGMTGWELAREAKAHLPTLRILFASGYPRDISAREISNNSIAILVKPFTRSDLERAVRLSLDGTEATSRL
ncbi:response regulator [Xanthomonas hortorum pv. gardneri]|nr:response regulator [Xanthomonas hortorum]KLA94580.1 hydrogenase expression protein HupH [Xanthomonas hortorum pv. gardneri]KLB20147.1 hydrogenase expression protein HupH [Xanthomonas hortorum pv. gardneri]KLB31238.1 hydrogenase expression protein HupH [Xanthomonas hortorum pv. gardneri]KLB32409.1 hydrogenase expression protein HupH [Xanthomonas hortorum pv. gardneri]MCC8654112.1 response regulator [Xanthomonas hortorum pv. gardneri]